MTQVELSFNLAVEAGVMIVVAVVFVIVAAVTLRERHRDGSRGLVLVGAGIYGVIVGIIIGFVVVPMRAVLMNGDLPPQTAAAAGAFVLAVMVSLRRGVVGRLPLLGPQVRAFRRANLRRTIETASRTLETLERADNRR